MALGDADAVIRGINEFPEDGIQLNTGDSNVIEHVVIGTTLDSTGRLGNGAHGIWIHESSYNRIGGDDFSQSNIIAFNGGAGVMVENGIGNTVRRNSMFGNDGLGIDLWPAGVTANDSLDLDTISNRGQNFPVVDSITSNGVSSTAYGSLRSEANESMQ